MINLFFALFFIFATLFLINIRHRITINLIAIISAIILILVSGLRARGVDRDFFIYKGFWMTKKLRGNVEDSFYFIRNFIKEDLGLDFQYLLLTYAFLGVSIKLISIRKLSPLFWGSLLIYFSNYYILHEFTQIRIGVATGFLLMSLYFLSDKKYILFYFFAIIAVFFHQSCFFVLVFPVIQNTEKNLRFYYLVVPLGYLFYFFNTYLNFKIPIPSLQEKIDLYETATESGFMKDEKTNVFNALFLIRISILNIILYFAKKIHNNFSGVYLFVKIYSFSLFSYLFLSKIPVFAFRIQELLGVVEIILIPCIIFIFPQKFRFLGVVLIFMIALIFFLMNIFYIKLLIE
ncbi:hypothetical protein GSF70_03800 [Flavobacteriaceae bacterium W22]|nr:hypothetical protein [Flavobacteriaceae bacterium W22]